MTSSGPSQGVDCNRPADARAGNRRENAAIWHIRFANRAAEPLAQSRRVEYGPPIVLGRTRSRTARLAAPRAVLALVAASSALAARGRRSHAAELEPREQPRVPSGAARASTRSTSPPGVAARGSRRSQPAAAALRSSESPSGGARAERGVAQERPAPAGVRAASALRARQRRPRRRRARCHVAQHGAAVARRPLERRRAEPADRRRDDAAHQRGSSGRNGARGGGAPARAFALRRPRRPSRGSRPRLRVSARVRLLPAGAGRLQTAQVRSSRPQAQAAQQKSQRLQGRRLHSAPAQEAAAHRERDVLHPQGTTASGLPTGPGIVAVDPTVIPLGTRMYIPATGKASPPMSGAGSRATSSTSGTRRTPSAPRGAGAP